MNFRESHLIVLLATLFLPAVLFSQFTYLDISLGNKLMNIHKSKNNSYKTKHSQTDIQINGLWRFKRHFGVGASVSVPVRKSGNFNLQTSDGDFLNKYNQAQSPVEYDYYFKESAKFAVNGRIYAGIKANLYFDGRISFFNFKEYLILERPLPVEVLEENSFKQIAPGFSVGMRPHVGRKLFLNFNLAFDFYTFKDTGFKNGLVNGVVGEYPTVKYSEVHYFKSQMPDKKTAVSFNFGLGYFF